MENVKRGSRKKVVLIIIAVLVVFGLFRACSGDKKLFSSFKAVPNVMGISYEDAKTVLEDAGFKVTAVEADAADVLPNTYYNRTVKKNNVFKVNDEVNPNYSDRERSPIADKKKVTIYYAIDDYIFVEPEIEEKIEDIEDDLTEDVDDTEAIDDVVVPEVSWQNS